MMTTFECISFAGRAWSRITAHNLWEHVSCRTVYVACQFTARGSVLVVISPSSLFLWGNPPCRDYCQPE